MPDIRAQFPLKGVNEGEAYTGQPPATTREAVNVQGNDPVSGRNRGAQRSGLSLYNTSQLNGANKVADLSHVVYDSGKTTWSQRAELITDAEWQNALPSGGDCFELALDRQNNTYTIDGLASIAKYNSAGVKVFTLPVPVTDQQHEIRSLAVDPSEYIFCGVSQGGDQNTAKLFAYEQVDSSTNNRIWDLTVGLYAKRLVVDRGLLYCAFDDLIKQRSYIHVYDAIQTAVPLLKAKWEVPYPVNDLCISGADSGIVTAHEPNSLRGISSSSPGTTASSIDWTPNKLRNYEKKLWCWFDATDVDGDGTNNSNYENGEEVLTWYDKSGNNRHLYRNIDAINATTLAPDSGPTLLKGVVAGRDACSFNGSNQSLVSGAAVTATINATSQQLRSQNLTLWPSEAGAQFALFAVIRAPQEEVVRVLFAQDASATHNYDTCRAMMLNRNPANTALFTTGGTGYTQGFGPAAMLGNVCWAEQTATGSSAVGWTSSPAPVPNGTKENAATIALVGGGTVANTVGFRPAAGASQSDYTLITLIQNGGSLTNTGTGTGEFNSKLYINGTLCDRWNSRSDLSSVFPVHVGWSRANPAPNTEYRFKGLLCEILVLSDWYEAPTAPFEASTRRYPVTSTPENNQPQWAYIPPLGGSFTGTSYYGEVPGAEKGPNGWESKLIEGYLAHKWGMAHLLPSGQRSVLKVSQRQTAPSTTTTVTIDNTANNTTATKVYQYITSLTSANDVKIETLGGTVTCPCYSTLLNLYYAINAGPKSGIAYHSGTTAAASLFAYPPVGAQSASGFANASFYMQIGTKSNLLSEGVNYSEGFAATATNHAWIAYTTGVFYTSLNHQGATTGSAELPATWLQHPFYLYRPFKNTYEISGNFIQNDRPYGSIFGGPPRADGRRLATPYQAFANPYGLVCKWDSGNGYMKWFVGSRVDGDESQTYSGIGYGIVSNASGLLCTAGPLQAEVLTSPPRFATVTRQLQGGLYSSDVTIRTIKDNKDNFSVAASDTWTQSRNLTASTNSFEQTDYDYIRMATDAFGNFYVPWADAEGNASRYCLYTMTYKDATTLGAGSPILHKFSGLKSSVDYAPRGLCVVANQVKNDYTDSGITEANSQAEYVVVGLKNENACTLTAGASVPTVNSSIQFTYAGVSYAYTFKTVLTTANDVFIVAGDPTATLVNLARAISLTGTAGTDYHNSTVANPVFGAKTILSGASVVGVVIQVKSSTKRSDTIAPFTVVASSTGTTSITATTPTFYDENIRRIKQVDSAMSTGTTRRFKTIGISNGAIKEFDNTATVTSVTGTGFTSASSDFYQSAILFQKVYITNGQEVVVYNPKKASSELLKSTTAGEVPKRCKLIASWRSRLVLARPSDSPHNWFMSAIGDPTDWDLFPKVVNSGQAIAGTISKAGLVPDTINTLVPYSDDLMIIGGDHSIYRLTGDPMSGGQMDLLTDVTGMAFGQAWDKDPQGNLYFLSPRGQLYMMRPGRNGMLELTGDRFEQRLADVDLTNNYVRLVWNDLERQLHIFVMPFGAGGTHLRHFRYERANDAFWQDEFGPTTGTDVQPTAAIVVDADDPADRTLLLGGEDGRVRRWDKSSRNDQRTTSTSYPIDSQVVMGPYGLPDAEIRLTKIQAVMASDQQRANIQIFASDTPDSMGNMVWSGSLMPGRNPNIFARAKGSYFWIRIRNAWADERWAFENMTLTVAKAGRKRMRP